MTIDLYTYSTPNGRKVSIMLEETGLPYDVHIVDIERGDQHSPQFRALSQNGKIPVIVDRANGRTVFESGAILSYLAEKSGRFNPPTSEARIETLQMAVLPGRTHRSDVGTALVFQTLRVREDSARDRALRARDPALVQRPR